MGSIPTGRTRRHLVGARVTPFRIAFTLSRRQRLAVELMPWLPAVAASLGFAVGAAFLATAASPGFLLLLLVPPLMYRGLVVLVFDLVVRGGRGGRTARGRSERRSRCRRRAPHARAGGRLPGVPRRRRVDRAPPRRHRAHDPRRRDPRRASRLSEGVRPPRNGEAGKRVRNGYGITSRFGRRALAPHPRRFAAGEGSRTAPRR